MSCSRSPVLLKSAVRALLQESKPQAIARKYGTVSPQLTTPQFSVVENALVAQGPRNNWTREEIKEIYDTPLMELAFAAVS